MADNNLKPGWKTWRFDQMAENIGERADPTPEDSAHYVGLEHMDTDSLLIRRWGSKTDLIGQKLKMGKGDILFARRNAYLKRVAIAPHDGLFSAHGMVLRAKPTVVLPEFLPFFMQSDIFMDRAIQISVGSLSPTINWKALAGQEFALPPTGDQYRFLKMLLAADLAISSYKGVVENLENMQRTTAKHLFAATLSGGEYVLEDLLEYGSDGPFGSDLKSIHYADHGVRVIRQQNIGVLEFKDTNKAYISESYYKSKLSRFSVQPNDVLIGGIGDPVNPPGRACLTPINLGPAINKAHGYCLRAKAILRHDYLVCFLNSPFGLRQTMAQAQGSAQIHLTLKKIKNLRIPLPSIEVQMNIAKTLNDIHKARQVALARHNGLSEIKKLMLERLLG